MLDINNKLIVKIQKLLRLGDSPNQHEAELALEKARALCVENDIDIATVKVQDREADKMVNVDLSLGRRSPVTAMNAARIVQNHFNVRVIWTGGRQNGRKVNFVGQSKDTAIAGYVFDFLLEKFMDLWHKYQEEHRLSARSRGSYIYGLEYGLGQKLTEAKKRAESEKFASLDSNQRSEVQNNYALMIVSKKEQLLKAVGEFYPKLRKGQNQQVNLTNNRAISDGIRDGKAIEINKSVAYNQDRKKLDMV